MVMLTIAARDAATAVWSAVRSRNLIGSDIAIVLTCALHVFEGSIFLVTSTANGSIGMASLLLIFSGHPWFAALALYGFAALAVIAEWHPDLSRLKRFAFLLPQFFLLMVTSLGAIGFVIMQHYADGVPRGWAFIACDQAHRIGMPIWYATAIVARVKE